MGLNFENEYNNLVSKYKSTGPFLVPGIVMAGFAGMMLPKKSKNEILAETESFYKCKIQCHKVELVDDLEAFLDLDDKEDLAHYLVDKKSVDVKDTGIVNMALEELKSHFKIARRQDKMKAIELYERVKLQDLKSFAIRLAELEKRKNSSSSGLESSDVSTLSESSESSSLSD